jgi:hypothetical protein
MHAFNSSEVQRSQLEAAAARVFKGRFQIGQFDPSAPKTPWDSLTGAAVYSKANQQIALEGAQQSPGAHTLISWCNLVVRNSTDLLVPTLHSVVAQPNCGWEGPSSAEKRLEDSDHWPER